MHTPTPTTPLLLPLLFLLLLTILTTPLLATPLQTPSTSNNNYNNNENDNETDNENTPADAKATLKTACHDIDALRKDILAHGVLSEGEQETEMMDMLFEQSLGCGEVFGDGEDGGDGMGDVVVFDGGGAD